MKQVCVTQTNGLVTHYRGKSVIRNSTSKMCRTVSIAVVFMLLLPCHAQEENLSPPPGLILLHSVTDGISLQLPIQHEHSVQHATFSNLQTGNAYPLRVVGQYIDALSYTLNTGCDPSHPHFRDGVAGQILVIGSGKCLFAEKAEVAAKLGAVGLIVVDHQEECKRRNSNSGVCTSSLAPIMTLGSQALTVDPRVFNLTAVSITNEQGVELVSFALKKEPVLVEIRRSAYAGDPPNQFHTDGLNHDNNDNPSTDGGLFGTFVLFSGCLTIVMLGVISMVQFRQHRLRARRNLRNNMALNRQMSRDSDRVLSILPTKTYTTKKGGNDGSNEDSNKDDGDDDDDDDDVCCICLDNFHEGDTLRTLPCNHRWHKDCIDPWLRQNVTCPMCKDNVFIATGVHAARPQPGPQEVIVDESASTTAEIDLVELEEGRQPSSDPVLHYDSDDTDETADESGFVELDLTAPVACSTPVIDLRATPDSSVGRDDDSGVGSPERSSADSPGRPHVTRLEVGGDLLQTSET